MSFIEKIPNANVVILSLDSLLAEFWKLLFILKAAEDSFKSTKQYNIIRIMEWLLNFINFSTRTTKIYERFFLKCILLVLWMFFYFISSDLRNNMYLSPLEWFAIHVKDYIHWKGKNIQNLNLNILWIKFSCAKSGALLD